MEKITNDRKHPFDYGRMFFHEKKTIYSALDKL